MTFAQWLAQAHVYLSFDLGILGGLMILACIALGKYIFW
jgi:hypothetical protein